MKLAEIKDLAIEEFDSQLKKSKLELVDLKMKFASRQLENPSQIKKKRKEIAWLHTIKTQKQKGLLMGEKKIKKEKEVKIKTEKGEKDLKPKKKTRSKGDTKSK